MAIRSPAVRFAAMKPVRIPNKLTSKKLLVRIFALYLVGFVLFVILTALTLPNSVIALFGGAWFFSFFAVLCTSSRNFE